MAKQKQEASNIVKIDGVEYKIEKLNFESELQIAEIILNVLESSKVIDSMMNGAGTINYAMALKAAVSSMPQIISIGLGVDPEVIKKTKESNKALEALDMIMKMNSFKEIVGKSSALLATIQ